MRKYVLLLGTDCKGKGCLVRAIHMYVWVCCCFLAAIAMQSLFQTLESDSAREDMLHNLREQLLVQFARDNQFPFLLLGDSCTRLAIRTLGNTAKGRGRGLPLELAFSRLYEEEGWLSPVFLGCLLYARGAFLASHTPTRTHTHTFWGVRRSYVGATHEGAVGQGGGHYDAISGNEVRELSNFFHCHRFTLHY